MLREFYLSKEYRKQKKRCFFFFASFFGSKGQPEVWVELPGNGLPLLRPASWEGHWWYSLWPEWHGHLRVWAVQGKCPRLGVCSAFSVWLIWNCRFHHVWPGCGLFPPHGPRSTEPRVLGQVGSIRAAWSSSVCLIVGRLPRLGLAFQVLNGLYLHHMHQRGLSDPSFPLKWRLWKRHCWIREETVRITRATVAF